MPFVPYDDRPISIDEGSREVRLPHETGISMMTRDHGGDWKRHRATKNRPIGFNVVFTHADTVQYQLYLLDEQGARIYLKNS